jgi:hypothetical protein
MTKFKVLLTEDEWYAAAIEGGEVTVALHDQQPELYARLLERHKAEKESKRDAAQKSAQEQADAEAKAKAAQTTTPEPPKNEPPAAEPEIVEDAAPKAPVRKSGK